MAKRRFLRRLTTPVVVAVALLYFIIDALFLSLLRPVVTRLARLPVFGRIAAWVARLGPYPTLALFLVPIVILEPVKPVGFYLIGTGHMVHGALVIAIGELLKITLVERLFHLSRHKLMSIPAFAWVYGFVVGWLARLRALPAWQAVLRRVNRIKALTRRLTHRIADQFR